MTTAPHRSWRALGRPAVTLCALVLILAGCGLSEGDSGGQGGDAAPTAIKVALLSDCEGAFGSFWEQTLGGAYAAFANYAGGTPKNRAKPSDGMTGIKVAGKDIQIVGQGCSDDTADTAIQETRRLMEQLRADVLIGPLSGDEAIAVANYAKSHPNQTFINGTAGSVDPTLKVQAPNFFRYHGDGAQWNAGTGDLAFNRLGWRTAAVIGDDYSFPYASTAGFIADFCGVGGNVVKRVWPPLNTTDYSSFIRQLPRPSEVDGYFWAIGGAGTIPALKAFEQVYGPIDPKQHMGNLFWGTPGQFEELGERVAGVYVGAAGTAGDLKTPQATAYADNIGKVFDAFPPNEGAAKDQAASTFVYNYYNATWAFIKALESINGDMGANQKALQDALAKVELADAGYGPIKLDSNRQGIQDMFIQQLFVGPDGKLGIKTVLKVPQVDQSFGGTFTPQGEVPNREVPSCERRSLPWAGKAVAVTDGVPAS